jgi:uncharacterized protein YbcV (DUF1398 family)
MSRKTKHTRIEVKVGQGWVVFDTCHTTAEALERMRLIEIQAKHKGGELDLRVAKYRKCKDGVYRWIVEFDEDKICIIEQETVSEATHV